MATEEQIRGVLITPRRLWFGLAASAVAWATLGFIDILITWRACVHNEQYGNPRTDVGVTVLYLVVATVLFIVVVAAGIVSYRNWRAISLQNGILNATAPDRREFMALLGVFVSVTLGMGVLWLAIPPLVIQLCLRAK
jgi:hypothetical protein